MSNSFVQKVKAFCRQNKIKFTPQREVIARVIEDSSDHPDAEKIFERAEKIDEKINLATVYRSITLFEKYGLLKKHFFGSQKARYEVQDFHDHIIDIESKVVLEFETPEIKDILKNILKSMNYNLIDYNLEVYAIKKKTEYSENKDKDEDEDDK